MRRVWRCKTDWSQPLQAPVLQPSRPLYVLNWLTSELSPDTACWHLLTRLIYGSSLVIRIGSKHLSIQSPNLAKPSNSWLPRSNPQPPQNPKSRAANIGKSPADRLKKKKLDVRRSTSAFLCASSAQHHANYSVQVEQCIIPQLQACLPCCRAAPILPLGFMGRYRVTKRCFVPVPKLIMDCARICLQLKGRGLNPGKETELRRIRWSCQWLGSWNSSCFRRASGPAGTLHVLVGKEYLEGCIVLNCISTSFLNFLFFLARFEVWSGALVFELQTCTNRGSEVGMKVTSDRKPL